MNDQETLTARRQTEFDKYDRCYRVPTYKISDLRLGETNEQLQWCYDQGCRTYLDVACGRAETLRDAEAIGFHTVQGTEVVEYLIGAPRVVYAECHALPFGTNAFHCVSLLDVLEHLLDGDEELAVKEVFRVASKCALLTTNDRPVVRNGDNLHINLHPLDWWTEKIDEWAPSGVTTEYVPHPTRPTFITWWFRSTL